MKKAKDEEDEDVDISLSEIKSQYFQDLDEISNHSQDTYDAPETNLSDPNVIILS